MTALQSAAIEPTPHLAARHVERSSLTSTQRSAMYELLCDHFEGVTRAVFETDLAEKDWVVLLEDATARLRGFSTFCMYTEQTPEGSPTTIVYSGDTIVDRSAWGTPTLPRSWIHAVYKVHATHFPGTKLFWLLITSGFRTYRFLPVFWRSFYPRFDEPTPAETQNWLQQIATNRFGQTYNPATGIVRLPSPQRLRGELRVVPIEKQADPHVAFFIASNPGHVDGDELVCLADLSREHLTPAGRRMVYGPAARKEA